MFVAASSLALLACTITGGICPPLVTWADVAFEEARTAGTPARSHQPLSHTRHWSAEAEFYAGTDSGTRIYTQSTPLLRILSRLCHSSGGCAYESEAWWGVYIGIYGQSAVGGQSAARNPRG